MSAYNMYPQKWEKFFGDWAEDSAVCADGEMSQNLFPYTELFSPININRLKIKNRVVMAPIGNITMCDELGRPSNKMIEYYAARAKGGTGLINSGLVPVGQSVEATLTEKKNQTVMPRINGSRTVWPGWRDIASKVHSYGGKFFIQLSPGLGRVGSPECLINKYKLPLSSSWNPAFYMPEVPCRPIHDCELKKLIKLTGQAAADAKVLTIDGVYLHGHMGYLIEQMSDTAWNRRWFGRYRASKWQRFPIDLVKEIRRRCGAAYPITYRLDLTTLLNATYGERMKKIKPLRKFTNERTIDMTLELMKNLVKAGVDAFDVDLGCYDDLWLPHLPQPMPPGSYREVAAVVKKYFTDNAIKSNAGFPVPIIAVGKMGYPDMAEKSLRTGQCDMVMLGRPLLADPEWANKSYSGRVAEISPCIGDLEGCVGEFVNGGHPQCAVNPRTGFEDVIPAEVVRTLAPKKVAVVGGGPAGVMCACMAAERGHAVTLFEKNDSVGGTLIPGAVPKTKFDMANYLRYMRTQVELASKKYGLTVRYNTAADAALLKEGQFDAIVTAVGASPIKFPVPGIDKPHVIQAIDFLRNPSVADKAEHIVIIGGGVVGVEMAHFLAYEKNKKDITVVEMLPYFMKLSNTPTRGYLIHYIQKKGVKLFNCTKLVSIDDASVTVKRNFSKSVPDPYNTWTPVLPDNVENPLARPIKNNERDVVLSAELVILSMGFSPNDKLYAECVKQQLAPSVYNIGDSSVSARVLEATKAAFSVASAL